MSLNAEQGKIRKVSQQISHTGKDNNNGWEKIKASFILIL